MVRLFSWCGANRKVMPDIQAFHCGFKGWLQQLDSNTRAGGRCRWGIQPESTTENR
jgi:hypothetical protein